MQKGSGEPGRRTAEEVDDELGKVLATSVKLSAGNRKWLRRISVPILFDVMLTFGLVGVAFQYRHNAHTTCVRFDQQNTKERAFWEKQLRSPRAPLKPDATPAERRAYDEAGQARDAFQRDVNQTFGPVNC